MEERTLEALIVFSNPSSFGPGTSTHGYIRYLCNWTSASQPSFLIIPRKEKPTLFVPSGPDFPSAQERTNIPNIIVSSVNKYGYESSRILKKANKTGCKMGVIGREEIPFTIYQELVDGLSKVHFEDANDILDDLRMIKSEKEIQLLRDAASISDKMFNHLLEIAAEGWWGYQAMAKMEGLAKVQGAEYAKTWLISKPV
ncbi:MAG: aminopeptidase P family N-terminal domain-containing protein, partial [Candidatus Bathyarchaeota archaeon]